jgi:hypothetical protein
MSSMTIIAKTEGVNNLYASDMLVSGGDLTMLGLMGIIYMIIVFVFEYLFTIKHIGTR